MTKKCNRLRGERPKAFWGALVGGAMNLIGSAISSKSQARAIRRQIEAQKEDARTQLELANNNNLASTLNSYVTATRSYNDEDVYNLKYSLGGNKRLGSNRIYITDGGNATKIGNDTYLLRGVLTSKPMRLVKQVLVLTLVEMKLKLKVVKLLRRRMVL